MRQTNTEKQAALTQSVTTGAYASACVPKDAEFRAYDGFTITPNGMVFGQPSFADAEQMGRALLVVERGMQFAVGDFVNYVRDRFNEDASQILDANDGWCLKTLEQYAWLAKRVEPDVRRMDRLGVAHHVTVAALTKAQQKKWLTAAADDEADEPWTVSRLKSALKEGEDLPPTGFFVLVACSGEDQQRKLVDKLVGEGFGAKPIEKRTRKKGES